MSWNYRIVKKNISEDIAIYEIKDVYFDENGNIEGYSNIPVPYGESVKEIKESLDLMYEALRQPIIPYEIINDKKGEEHGLF